MAESSTRRFSAHSSTFDDVLIQHKVGGKYLTLLEYLDVVSVMNRQKSPDSLPCRVRSVCGFFRSNEVFDIAECIVSRCSFDYTQKDMNEMIARFSARGPPHYEKIDPMIHFLKMIVESFEIRPASFIAKKCFTLQWCNEHECCRQIHQWGEGQNLRLVCCDLPTCTSPFGFAASKKPEADIERIVMKNNDRND